MSNSPDNEPERGPSYKNKVFNDTKVELEPEKDISANVEVAVNYSPPSGASPSNIIVNNDNTSNNNNSNNNNSFNYLNNSISHTSSSSSQDHDNLSLLPIPTNTIVASDGGIYHIEPFQLPPPSEIAKLVTELKDRRNREDSNNSTMDSWERRMRGESLLDPVNSSGQRSRANSNLSEDGGSPMNNSSINNNNHYYSTHYSSNTNVTISNSNNSSGNNELRRRRIMMQSVLSNHVRPPPLSLGGAVGMNVEQSSSRDSKERDYRLMNKNMKDNMKLDGSELESDDSFSPSMLDNSQKDVMIKSNSSSKEQREREEEATAAYKLDKDYYDPAFLSIGSFLLDEIFGVREPVNVEHKAVDSIQNFLAVPVQLEQFVSFGWWVCFDAFLHNLTILPIRFIYALMLLVTTYVSKVFGLSELKWNVMRRTNVYDVIRMLLLLGGFWALTWLNMSRVYHYVRQQNTVKLYVLTGMLEIFDKLLCSFGQDAFDSLYWQIRNDPAPRNFASSFSIAMIYVCIHSALYFLHVATLTVAINSSDQAMIAVLILNNFAEIKSFVFKKFDKQNLFQLACADITERFNLTLFMGTILLVGVVQAGSLWREMIHGFTYTIMGMIVCESTADWIKHAFITKFNHIDAAVYADYTRILRKDVLSSRRDLSLMDRTVAITRRVGLSQIPLTCVFLRYIWLIFENTTVRKYLLSMSTGDASNQWAIYSIATGTILSLLLLKVLVGLGVVSVSALSSNAELKMFYSKMQGRKRSSRNKERDASLAKLKNIERYTIHKGRVVG